MIPLASSCVSILVALAMVQVPVQAQTTGTTGASAPGTSPAGASTTPATEPSPSSTIPATTAAPTLPSTSAATTTIATISTSTTTTTTTVTSVITPSTSNIIIPTTHESSIPPYTRPTDPFSSAYIPSSTNSVTQSALPSSTAGGNGSGGSTSSSSTTNVPAIVGSIAGIAALAIIVATTFICYRRRRSRNRELTFDALQGMSGPSLSTKRRTSHGYLTSASPAMSGGGIGLNSVTSGGYDDGYDYEMQSNAGYPAQHPHQQSYSNAGYDNYGSGSPHQGYHPSPTIFQEDHHLPMTANYATASSMSRNRAGFDQNLPEVMYNGGDGAVPEDAAAAGYYNDIDMYNNTHWHPDELQQQQHQQQQVGGLWVANPEDQNYAPHPDMDHSDDVYASGAIAPPMDPVLMSAHSLDSTLVGSPKEMKLRGISIGANPQELPDSPILHSTTLRGGDVFGQDSEVRAAASPRMMSPRVATREASSPQLMNSNRELRSIELSRQSPTPRSSGEGMNTYASDYPTATGRPSVDERGSPANLNGNRSLRTLRREDWS